MLIGFAIFSIRSEYVEGSEKSPVGYLEAIVIDDNQRGQGLAEKLVNHGIEWCKSKGCAQVGSDVELQNKTSQLFHEKLGFKEVNRLVCYIRDI